MATASTRMPPDARRSLSAVRASTASSSRSCSSPSPSTNDVQRPSSTSGAPLTHTSTSLWVSSGSIRWNVAMNLWAESNGTSPRRGRSRRAIGGVDAGLGRDHHEGRLGRVADDAGAVVGVAGDGVGAEGRRQQGPLGHGGGHGAAVGVGDLAVGGVALAAHRPDRPAPDDLPGRHLVQGEGAGLVRADHRRGAQRLDRVEPLHDGVLLGHPGDADGEGHRDDGGQALGDGGDREGDGPEGGVGEVLALGHLEHEHQAHRDDGDHRQALAQPVELASAAACRPARPRRAARRPCPSRCPCPWRSPPSRPGRAPRWCS